MFVARISVFEVRGSRFEVRGSRFRVQGSRFEVRGSRFKVRGSRFKVRGSRFEVRGSRFEVQGSRFEVRGSRFKVRGSRFKVRGSRFRVRFSDFGFQISPLGFRSLKTSHCLRPAFMLQKRREDNVRHHGSPGSAAQVGPHEADPLPLPGQQNGGFPRPTRPDGSSVGDDGDYGQPRGDAGDSPGPIRQGQVPSAVGSG